MKVSLSLDIIAETVIARAALRHTLHADRPAMLTRDHRSAIELLASRGFCAVCVALLPAVKRCDTGPSPEGVLTADVEGADPEAVMLAGLADAMNEAVADYVMMRAFEGADSRWTAALTDSYTRNVERARSICGMSARGSIRPCWY